MRKVGMLLIIALLLALVPTALAGGWALITLDDMPGEIRAGEPWTVGFTVLQHGRTPVHRLDDGYGGVMIEPTLIAANSDTGERVQVTATPTSEVGHFTLQVTFPSEGAWEWTIEPAPLAGETQFEPLTVLPAAIVAPLAPEARTEPVVKSPVVEEPPAAVAPAMESSFPTSAALWWGALAVALAAVALFAVHNRRQARAAS